MKNHVLTAMLMVACSQDPGITAAGGGESPGSGVGGLAPGRPGADAGGITGSPDNTGGVCSSTSAKAMALPVDILIVQDRSGSMKDPAMAGGALSKWNATKQALGAFVQAPAASGLNVGLGFFPQGGRADGGGSCDAARYAMPAVPIAALPGVGVQVAAALDATMPMGGTPTLPALRGAVQYARRWEATMNRRVAIALATDGEPNDCNSTVRTVSAEAAMAASTGIFTFVIGVGPNLQNLEAIAMAGGTKAAYFADTASVDQLIGALRSIQSQAAKLACSFAIPPPPSGGALDPSRVNVRFTPASGVPVELGQVDGRGRCGPAGGWYYDNPAATRSVSLCDASCQLVNSSPDGELSLVFGCMTNVIK